MVALEYDDLSLDQLYEILRLRQEVFVVEQDCPYLDADNVDQKSIHVLGTMDDQLIAYSRVIPPNVTFKGYSSIGRIVTKKTQRGKGYGKHIIDYSIALCKEKYHEMPIKIGAQTYLLEYYQSFGFNRVGETYLEDGIEHQEMVMLN